MLGGGAATTVEGPNASASPRVHPALLEPILSLFPPWAECINVVYAVGTILLLFAALAAVTRVAWTRWPTIGRPPPAAAKSSPPVEHVPRTPEKCPAAATNRSGQQPSPSPGDDGHPTGRSPVGGQEAGEWAHDWEWGAT
eukprot:gene54112-26768_t